MFPFLRYFFYLAFNWNISIAWHIIKEERKGEKKYGINTTGADELKQLEEKGIDIDHATIYMPVSFGLLEDCFDQLKKLIELHVDAFPEMNHFLDIGCGKGRALCMAAHTGFKKVTGIDFSKELCVIAEQNLQITKEKIGSFEYTIINNDAFYFDIPETTDCIFLFNPFDDVIMSKVVENIRESLSAKPRKLWIIYVNPIYKDLFLEAGFNTIYHTQKMKYLEAVILKN